MIRGIQNIGEISLFIKKKFCRPPPHPTASNFLPSKDNILFFYLWASFLQKIFQNTVNGQLLCARKFLNVILYRQLVPDLQLKYTIKVVISLEYNTTQKNINREQE